MTILIISLLFFCSFAHATIWYVHPDSTLNSIQTALNSCSTGDTVLVGPGVYNETILWPEVQGIDLISEQGPDTTVIVGGSVAIVIYSVFDTAVDSTTRITGFRIQDGTESAMSVHNCSAVITDNLFIDNGSETGFYGVLDCERGSPVITGNVFMNNVGIGFKGAITCRCDSFDTPCIRDNTISNNPGYSGIYISGDLGAVPMSRAIITNNEIIGCGWFGILCYYPSFIKHNDIIGNTMYGISLARCRTTDIDSCTISYNVQHGIFKAATLGDSVTVCHCNIENNLEYGIYSIDSTAIVDAENNWWGDGSGPGGVGPGTGDAVSQYVDYEPWLENPFGVVEEKITPIKSNNFSATIISGPLLLPVGKKCKVFDITGRTVDVNLLTPGIYFIEIEGQVVQKIIKLR